MDPSFVFVVYVTVADNGEEGISRQCIDCLERVSGLIDDLPTCIWNLHALKEAKNCNKVVLVIHVLEL